MAFYFYKGATKIGVRRRPLRKKKSRKEGFSGQYVMTAEIPARWVEIYLGGKAQVEVQKYANARRRLKREIKRLLGI